MANYSYIYIIQYYTVDTVVFWKAYGNSASPQPVFPGGLLAGARGENRERRLERAPLAQRMDGEGEHRLPPPELRGLITP